MKKLWFLIGFSLCTISGFSQTPRLKLDSLKHALANAQQDKGRVMTLSYLSHAHVSYNTDSALILAQQALDLARKINYRQGEAQALFYLGYAYRVLSDIPNSMRATLKGLQLAEEQGYRKEAALCYSGIGSLYMVFLNNPSSALNYFKKAKQLNAFGQGDFDKFWIVSIDANLGGAYRELGEFDSAAYMYDRALANLNMYPGMHAPILRLIGLLHQKQKKYREAQYFYSQSAAVTDSPRGQAELNYFQASCYQEMGMLDSCIYYARKSLAAAEQIGLQREIMNSANLLASVYEVQKQPEALRYFKIAKLANDKVFGEQKVQELQRIITEEIQRQQEIERQKTAYENRIRLYALFSGLAVMLLVAFLLYRNNLQKQKANAILERSLDNLKATQAQLIQSEKMASLGELTAGIAHEIQNPLNFVNNYSEVNVELLEELRQEFKNGDPDEVQQIINDLSENEAKIHHHGRRADSIVRGMLLHSRTHSGTREPTDLNALADEYLRLAYHGIKAKDNNFQAEYFTDFEPNLPKVEVVPSDIGRALLNIINNAFQAVNEKRLEGLDGYQPTVKVTTRMLNEKLEVRISDNGTGIPAGIRDKIFQPFFTTRPTGQGTGLGMSLAYDTVKAHGGGLRVESEEGVGTEFIIELPIKI